MRRAAESGLAVAQNDLGDCYYLGEGVEESSTEAFRWFTKAAKQGLPEAEKNLGFCHEHGEGVEGEAPDDAEGVGFAEGVDVAEAGEDDD